MRLVGEFLSRFRNLTPPDDTLRATLSMVLKETLNISCTKDKISIARGVAYIKTSSVAKNTIQVHRAKVLESLFERLPKARDTVRDVR